jgi:acyl-CoA thioester hydrolase
VAGKVFGLAMEIETYRGVVYPWSIDHMGHMNVQFYTSRFDEASWHFLAQLGLTPNFLKSSNRGFAALEQKSQYRIEILAGTLLQIRTELLEVKSKTVRFIHRMIDSETGLTVATMELVVAYLDTQARKATPLPEEAVARADALLRDKPGRETGA